ncbi:MAG TPA: hypothetical protein VIU40_01530 [Geobacteraceae bacterium]
MNAAKKGNNRGSTDAVMEELGHELRHLRALVREVGESFILRREGEIEALIGHLANVPPVVLRSEAATWLRALRGLKVKPDKGRTKDLKGIDALIEELTECVLSAQDGSKGIGGGR